MRYDLVVRNGIVVDGTRAPRYRADLAVSGDRISALGLVAEKGRHEIDASGLVVAPGFIDAHTHDDRLMLSAPDMAPKVSQGVTTVVAGNCGISLAPAPHGMHAPVTPPLDLLDDEGGWFRFPTFMRLRRGAAQAIRRRRTARCWSATPCCACRRWTDLERPAGESEIAKMRRLVDEALQPARSASRPASTTSRRAPRPTEEVIEVCRPLSGATRSTARTCATRATA